MGNTKDLSGDRSGAYLNAIHISPGYDTVLEFCEML
jgi:hypothetical protein